MNKEIKTEKKRNWFIRHPIITMFIVFFILFVISNIAGDETEKIINSQVNLNNYSINEITIRNEQIPTEWIIKELDNERFIDLNYKAIVRKQLIKQVGFSADVVNYNLIEFENNNKANLYYEQIVKEINDKRGFEDLGFNNNVYDKSFSYKKGSEKEVIAIKDNYLLIVKGASYTYISTSDITDLVSTTAANIRSLK